MSAIFFDAFTQFGPRIGGHGAHPWSLRHLIDELDHCSISAALATLLAIQFGFTFVLLAALVIYGCSLLLFMRTLV